MRSPETSPEQKEFESVPKIKGIVVFAFDSKGYMFSVIEKQNKPPTGKIAGQLSVVCETQNAGEDPLKTALRGVHEEVGIKGNGTGELQQHVLAAGDLGMMRFTEHCDARVFVARVKDDFPAKSTDEVDVVGFLPLDMVLHSNLREGVKNVLKTCLDKKLLNGWINPDQFNEEKTITY